MSDEEFASRMASGSRLVRVSASVPVRHLVVIDGLARQMGFRSRSEAIREALMIRSLTWQAKVDMRRRVAISRLLRDAENWAPIDDLLREAAAACDRH